MIHELKDSKKLFNLFTQQEKDFINSINTTMNITVWDITDSNIYVIKDNPKAYQEEKYKFILDEKKWLSLDDYQDTESYYFSSDEELKESIMSMLYNKEFFESKHTKNDDFNEEIIYF